MGCFNVACALTGHSMYSDDAVFIGLIRSPYDDYEHDTASMCYTFAKYTPIFLPIYGTLDSYGKFDSIDETPYTKYLESIGLDPYKLVQCKLPKGHTLGRMSGCFISRQALEHSSKYLYDDCGRNVQAKKVTTSFLKRLGISKDNLEKEPGYGKYILPNGLLYNSYMDVIEDSSGKYYTFEESCELLRSLGCPVDKVLTDIEGKSNFVLSMEQLELDTVEDYADSDDPRMAFLTKRLRRGEQHQFFRGLFGNLYLKEQYSDFISEYYTRWKEFSKEFDDLNNLQRAMAYSNKFWHPQTHGFQHGSSYQEYNLAKLQEKLSDVHRNMKYVADSFEEISTGYGRDFYTQYPETLDGLRVALSKEQE